MFKNALQALAQEKVKQSVEKKEKEKEKAPEEKLSVTYHTIDVEGTILRYKVTTGYMPIKEDGDKLRSKIFFTSYEKEGVKDKADRPITFTFNGGPGCASMWLHFGVAGPKIIKLDDDGHPLPPPTKIISNEYTWLRFTDLVFIDPVSTGYSRPADEVKADEFWGLQEDGEAVAEFIRMYTTRHERWRSPKYVAGESYGTTRAAKLSELLQEYITMDLNGIVLLSSAVDYQTLSFKPGNEIPYVLYLPAYTATAFYHKKLAPELMENLEKTLAEAEKWAIEKYLPALAKGTSLRGKERDEVVEKLAYYTGLSKKYVEHSNLRIHIMRYTKELLRDEYRTVGRLDSRYKGIDADAAGEAPEFDPSFFRGPFGTAINSVVREDYNYKNDVPYTTVSMEANMTWKWSQYKGDNVGYPNLGETVRKQICSNPYMHVFFACGYFDLATPYFAAKYTADHMGLDESLLDNVTLKKYEGGHMMYYYKPARIQLFNDLKAFYEKSNPKDK